MRRVLHLLFLVLIAGCGTEPGPPVTVKITRVPVTDPALLALQWNCTVTWTATATTPTDTFWFERRWNTGGTAVGVGVGQANFSSLAWLAPDHTMGIWWVVGTGDVPDGMGWRDTAEVVLNGC